MRSLLQTKPKAKKASQTSKGRIARKIAVQTVASTLVFAGAFFAGEVLKRYLLKRKDDKMSGVRYNG